MSINNLKLFTKICALNFEFFVHILSDFTKLNLDSFLELGDSTPPLHDQVLTNLKSRCKSKKCYITLVCRLRVLYQFFHSKN